MKVRELVEALVALDADEAHVEVLEHDGSWSWVSEASKLTLSDLEGVTETVVLHVSNEGVRMPSQQIGHPAPTPPRGSHEHPHEREI